MPNTLSQACREKLRARAQEFIALATDAQSSFVEMTKESAAKVAAQTTRVAAETTRAGAETARAGAEATRAGVETKKKMS